MVHRNASISNETISREQTIAKLRKLARICKWATMHYHPRSLWDFSQSLAILYSYCLASPKARCLQSVELQAGEGPCLAIIGTDAQAPLMLVAN